MPIYLDTHVIAYLLPNSLIYEIQLKVTKQNIKPLATHVLCVHHIESTFPLIDFKIKFPKFLSTHLNINAPYTNNLDITPPNTKVNSNTKWSNTTTYIEHNNGPIQQHPHQNYMSNI
jgi:hypothetical protein